jgi:hypothetical protein
MAHDAVEATLTGHVTEDYLGLVGGVAPRLPARRVRGEKAVNLLSMTRYARDVGERAGVGLEVDPVSRRR